MSVLAEQEVSVTKPKGKVEEMYIETLTKGESGYVRDDTIGTAFEDKINCAGTEFIPSTGNMAEEILDTKGQPTGRFKNVAIRYIKNCPIIKVQDQIKEGYEKSRISTTDAISITKGKALIKREGDIALFDYLKNVYYNQKAPNRPKSAKALYTVVEVEQKVNAVNEVKFIQAKAISYVEGLCLKGANGSYRYKENEIDNLLTALNVFGGDNYSEKINVLTREAEQKPENFLNVATALKSTVATEIAHALELNVIQFEGNTAQYVDGKQIVGTVPAEFKAQNKKIEALAEMLKTPEYAQAYQDLKAKLEIAEEKQLKA